MVSLQVKRYYNRKPAMTNDNKEFVSGYFKFCCVSLNQARLPQPPNLKSSNLSLTSLSHSA